ncbi:HEAT repeat domain-containing protein [Streptomyces sp. XM4193]|uniref:HEAT repeat domain-containing protein n=1 Tax=Streptomyces sp. XM4193 TaxID=2929782 RepID=UPI001FFBDA85|nr:HEAT repeat domain-containing protein [Streptomyces sp. XM4193]MCK1797220.1 HEAT repeat domain-containing protein [Streptomyces sp. XM4193]
MDDWLSALLHRARADASRGAATGDPERSGPRAYERLATWSVRAAAREPRTARPARDALARVLTEQGHPVWAQEVAACALAGAGDRRAFETLVFLLNYREPVRASAAAEALARLGDPRTARAAAALAGNELRTAYALEPVRLLARLGAPESVPVLVATLRRLLAGPGHYWPIARACVEGLGVLRDVRARPVLTAATGFPQLRETATTALARLPRP